MDLINQSNGNTDHDCGIFVRDSGIALNTKIAEAALAATPDRKPDKKKSDMKGRKEVCRRYYDVRMFGGVLAVGDYSCGQVRGPVQLTFARSIDPILPSDITITRVAITKENEAKETEMGRKALVPYGLYLGKGFFSPMLATDTGVSSDDLKLFWQALINMFENDRSAARGYMEMRGIYVYAHDNPLGNARSGKLFSRIQVQKKPEIEATRLYEHYNVQLDKSDLPAGVKLVSLLD